MHEFDDIRRKAIDLLARREHSRLELLRKLLSRDFLQQHIDVILDQLSEKGMLSDQRFTESYVVSRSHRGFGPVRLKQELSERGINADLVQHYLHEFSIGWSQIAKQVRKKRFGVSVPTDFKSRAKQMSFLQYRGFSIEQINEVFSE